MICLKSLWGYIYNYGLWLFHFIINGKCDHKEHKLLFNLIPHFMHTCRIDYLSINIVAYQAIYINIITQVSWYRFLSDLFTSKYIIINIAIGKAFKSSVTYM